MTTASVWHPLAISGDTRTRMESWACPDDCDAPCPLREATFWPETRAIVNAAVDALPNGRYEMRWTGSALETRPALFGVVFDRPDPVKDLLYAWGPFADADVARRFAEFASTEIDPARVTGWSDATALPGVRVTDPVSELLAWRDTVALPEAAEAAGLRSELAVLRCQVQTARQEAYDAECRADQFRDVLDDAHTAAPKEPPMDLCDEFGRPLDITEIDSLAGLPPAERAAKEAERDALFDELRARINRDR